MNLRKTSKFLSAATLACALLVSLSATAQIQMLDKVIAIVDDDVVLQGYVGMWVVLRFRSTSLLAACVSWFAVGFGSGWLYITSVMTNARNLGPSRRWGSCVSLYTRAPHNA